MNTLRRFSVTASAALVVLAMLAGPVAADVPLAAATDGDHRIVLAETPRDRLGLLLIGAMLFAGAAGIANARKQLRGERDQASGEFRWR